MTNPDYEVAHKHSSKHRQEIEESDICGCFYCLKLFPFSDIVEWIDDDTTAMCPHCGIDSVIGSKSGFPITIPFLQTLHDHWF